MVVLICKALFWWAIIYYCCVKPRRARNMAYNTGVVSGHNRQLPEYIPVGEPTLQPAPMAAPMYSNDNPYGTGHAASYYHSGSTAGLNQEPKYDAAPKY